MQINIERLKAAGVKILLDGEPLKGVHSIAFAGTCHIDNESANSFAQLADAQELTESEMNPIIGAYYNACIWKAIKRASE